MAKYRMSPEDHARVTAAVAAAEERTDGEIVTIVATQSDPYHDVALHYAVLAMLLVPAIGALFPALLAWKVSWLFHGGWETGAASPLALALFLVLIGEAVLFLLVRFLLAWGPLRLALTPGVTKARRVRRKAAQFFKTSAEKRTVKRVGILLYLSIAERRAEIVADAAIHSLVPQERWGEAMVALLREVRAGDVAGGMAAAVAGIADVLAEHFPKTEGDANELPDRLIEL